MISNFRTRIAVIATVLCTTGFVGAQMLHGASAAPTAASARLGFFPGYGNVTAFKSLESLLGRQIPYVVEFGDSRSGFAFTSSIWGEVINAGQWQTVANRVNFVESVPLTLGLGFGATVAQRAAALRTTQSGGNDAYWKLGAQYLVQGGYGDATIRLGWEFDGGWMPWSSNGNEALWASAYRHVADVFRSVSPNFRFDWNGDPSYLQNQVAAYPGDGYVDIIGLDPYDAPQVAWNSTTKTWADPAAAWAWFLPNFRWQRDFAIAHGKQVSYPEWGLSGLNADVTSNAGGDDPTYIQGMYDWMNSLPASGPGSLAYHSYFNSDENGNHRIDKNWFPNAQQRFHSLFGGYATGYVSSPGGSAPGLTTSGVGYSMLGADGKVYPFGSARNVGNASGPAMAIASRANGSGYWIVDPAGNVGHFGTAADHGGHPALRSDEWVSAISATPSGNGYWLFTIRGRAFAYGDAHLYGDLTTKALNGPIVGSVATPSGRGYYMVASDGGVFSFGDAHFRGSMGSAHLNKPIVGLSPTPQGRGYWLVASDGGVFAFNAPFRGSMGSRPLAQPVRGLVAYGNGYAMVASDGGVFTFSNKRFVGSLGNNPPSAPIVGIAAVRR